MLTLGQRLGCKVVLWIWIWYDMIWNEWGKPETGTQQASVSLVLDVIINIVIIMTVLLLPCLNREIMKLCLVFVTWYAARCPTHSKKVILMQKNLWIHIITKYHFSSLKLYVIFTKTYFWHCLLFHASRWTTRSILYTGTPTQIICGIFWRRWLPMIHLQM